MGCDVCLGMTRIMGFYWVEKDDEFVRELMDGLIVRLDNGTGEREVIISSGRKYEHSSKEHSPNIEPWKEVSSEGVYYFSMPPFEVITPKLEIDWSYNLDIKKFTMIDNSGRMDFLMREGKMMMGARLLSKVVDMSSIRKMMTMDIDYVLKDMSVGGDFYVNISEMYRKKIVGTFGLLLLRSIENDIKKLMV